MRSRLPHAAFLGLLALSGLAGCARLAPPAIQGADAGTARDPLPPDLSTLTGGDDWPRFLGPLGDGKSRERGLLRQWPEGGPPILWTKTVGRGYSQVAVSRGRLFVFDRKGDQARLSCWKSETGEELWRSEYPTDYVGFVEAKGGPMANPVVDGDRVYTFGAEGRLRCHRVSDGSLLWEVDTAARFGVVQNLYGAGSTPWVEGDLLIAIVGGSPPGSPAVGVGEVKGNGSGIVAFDKRTGEVRYQLSDELAGYASPLVTRLGGQRTGFAFTRGGLLVFDPRRGIARSFFAWRDRTGKGVNAATPVVVGDRVFITEAYGPGGALLKLRGDELAVLWRDPPRHGQSLASHWGTPLHHNGYLYGVSGRASGEAELRCVELATGKVMWSEKGLMLASLLYFDDQILVLTEYGRMILIATNPRRYEVLAEVNLGEPKKEAPTASPVAISGASDGQPAPPAPKALLQYPVWNAPVLSHGLLYVRGWGRIVCFDLRVKKGSP